VLNALLFSHPQKAFVAAVWFFIRVSWFRSSWKMPNGK